MKYVGGLYQTGSRELVRIDWRFWIYSDSTVVLQYPQGMGSRILYGYQIHICSDPLCKIMQHLHITYVHPSTHFKPSLDYLAYPPKWRSYVNSCYTVFWRGKKKDLFILSIEEIFSNILVSWMHRRRTYKYIRLTLHQWDLHMDKTWNVRKREEPRLTSRFWTEQLEGWRFACVCFWLFVCLPEWGKLSGETDLKEKIRS